MSARFTSIALAASLFVNTAGWAADTAVGKKIHEERCVDCHEPADFGGEDIDTLGASIKDIVTGKVKHKGKIKLTDDEIASIAAYWVAAGSK